MLKAANNWVDFEKCKYIEMGNFEEILQQTNKAGTDGSERPEASVHAKQVTAAAVVINANRTETASLQALVPGKQTVPRAELWAAICLADKAAVGASIDVVIDNQGVINGIRKRKTHLTSVINGDLWTLLYRACDEKQLSINTIKAKSHIKNAEQWTHYNMDIEKYLDNEVAGEAAGSFAKELERPRGHQEQDAEVINTAYLIALRVGAIEARCWQKAAESRQTVRPTTSTTRIKRSRLDKVNKDYDKAEEAITDTHQVTGWVGGLDADIARRSA